MSEQTKASGPASYFPSIEMKYGQPIDHWIKLVKQQKGLKHMELVNWLKSEHGLGHGHANAIVAFCFANKAKYLVTTSPGQHVRRRSGDESFLL